MARQLRSNLRAPCRLGPPWPKRQRHAGQSIPDAIVEWSVIGAAEISSTGTLQGRATATDVGFATVTAVQRGALSRRGTALVSVVDPETPSPNPPSPLGDPCTEASIAGSGDTFEVTLPNGAFPFLSIEAFPPYPGIKQAGDPSA